MLALPTVSITAPVAEAREGGSPAVIHLRRVGGNRTKPLTVALSWSGSAKARDLLGESARVTFPARAKTIDIRIGATFDRVGEAAETAKVSLVPSRFYRVDKALAGAAFRVVDPPRVEGKLSWRSAATAPLGRVEPETVVVGDRMYAFSGYTDDRWQPIRRVDRFDPVTNKWTRLRDMPIGITHAGVAVVGTKVWFAGGYAERVGTRANQDIAITTVKIYDTLTDTWADGPALPQQRGSGGMGLIGNTLYFTSGERRDRLSVSETWALDLSNTAAGWKPRAAIPEARTHFGTVVLNDQLYVMGGQQGVDVSAKMLASAFRYDPRADEWTRLANLPIAMSHYSPNTVVRNDKIYMLGGEQSFNVESTQVLEYDPATDEYRTLTPLPTARASGMAGVINGQFIFSGGKNNGWNGDTYIGTFG